MSLDNWEGKNVSKKSIFCQGNEQAHLSIQNPVDYKPLSVCCELKIQCNIITCIAPHYISLLSLALPSLSFIPTELILLLPIRGALGLQRQILYGIVLSCHIITYQGFMLNRKIMKRRLLHTQIEIKFDNIVQPFPYIEAL